MIKNINKIRTKITGNICLTLFLNSVKGFKLLYKGYCEDTHTNPEATAYGCHVCICGLMGQMQM